MNHIFRTLLSLSLLCCIPATAQQAESSSLGPLKRSAPTDEKPAFLAKVLGAGASGFPYQLGNVVVKVPLADHWLVEVGGVWQEKFLCLMKLDRTTGESSVVQKIDAAGHWCYIPKGNLLFGGRFATDLSKTPPLSDYQPPKLVYECLPLSGSQPLWTLPRGTVVLWAALSHDGNEIIVLQGPPAEEGTADGPAYVTWYDVKTGKPTRKVDLPGKGNMQPELYTRPVIADTPQVTYICRNSGEDYQGLQIGRKAEVAVPLVGGEEDFKGSGSLEGDANWFVETSDDFKWLVLHNTQEVRLFKRMENRVVPVETFNSGDSRTIGDDLRNVRFTPKSSHLVVGSMKKTTLYNLATMKVQKEMERGTTLSDISHDGSLIVHWHYGGSWPIEIASGKPLGEVIRAREIVHSYPIEELAFSRSGKYLVSADPMRFIVWDVQSGRALAALTSPREKERGYRGMTSPLVVDSHGKVYGADGWDIIEWDLAKISANRGTDPIPGTVAFGRKPRAERATYDMDIAVDSSGEQFVEADFDALWFFRRSAPEERTKLLISQDDLYKPRRFYFHPTAGLLMVFNLMRGSQVSLDGKTPQMPIKKQACAITPSGMFYDPSKARSERAEITRERLGVAAASMTPDTVIVGNPPWNFEWATTDASDDDRFFVYKNGSQRWDEVSVMDWEKKMQVRVFQTPSEVNVLKVSPDGKYVATAGNDKRIYLWDLGGL